MSFYTALILYNCGGKLFREIKASWVIPKGCFELLSTKFVALGREKKAKTLWGLFVVGSFLEHLVGVQ